MKMYNGGEKRFKLCLTNAGSNQGAEGETWRPEDERKSNMSESKIV